MRAQRLYRLHVTLPEGSDEYGWEPKGWADDPQHWYRDMETGAMELSPFTWPTVRTYVSRGGAEGRAWLLQKYGATVQIEVSEAVAWSGKRIPVRPDPRPEPVPEGSADDLF